MRQLRKLAAGIAVAVAVAVAASAVPALADPPVSGGKHAVPGTVDVVSVGANTDENLFNALSGGLRRGHSRAHCH
jgi:predicted dinucleotide-utilizing enzyme